MCLKKKDEEIKAEKIEANDIQATAIKITGNLMLGDFTCNFVWNDEIGAYVLVGYKE